MPFVPWNSRRRWRATMLMRAPIRSNAISVMHVPGGSRRRRLMLRMSLLDAACCSQAATNELPLSPFICCCPMRQTFGPLWPREATRRTAVSREQKVS
jgi:hypothetical protein